ncbi:MAG TPA: ATP-binding cassette domain-containing protein [Steroidobacteraceae bacterium]|nr:ATP-binding cassette domain-containing protein [Steroidobacteraceae bacterium]
MSQPVIEVSGIVNRFGAQVVHAGLDMQVLEGEVFGIVGGSGSGKSVLLRTILGLQRPRAGRVVLYGHDINSLSESELREVKRHYGVTFQHGALFTSLNITQNVQMPMTEFFDLEDEALDALARLKLHMVGLAADAGAKYPAQLSGGMIKRAALARALALDPRLLFLDEPTSGLDPIGAAEFDQLIAGLKKNLSLTVVMITHDLDTIFATCDRVGVIVDRRMVIDTVPGMLRNDHPWIHEYFHGPRARSAAHSRESDDGT